MKKLLVTLAILLSSLVALAQTDARHNDSSRRYRIVVVTRTTQAVNYRHRSGGTRIDFQGTNLLPQGGGNAEVASKQGAIQIEAEFRGLQPAGRFGPEYLTYVLWAISPEGRPVNLGEVLMNHEGESKLKVTSSLQAFGMIVTAEPYFAVTQPSDVVVLENQVRDDTKGTIEHVEAKYELLQRGLYESNVSPVELQPTRGDSTAPLELYEARNAVRIAKWTGADQYAGETLQKAEVNLQTAESLQAGRSNRKSEISAAREAVQTAEDARVITVKKMEEERQSSERDAATDAVARSRRRADDANRQKEQAQSETAQAKSDLAEGQAASANAVAAAQADANQSRSDAQRSDQRAQAAEGDKAEMRARLETQLNSILQTRDSARGLIVSMSDVLFDTGQYNLTPGAREKLAKVAGILLAYPGLNIAVGGYTDNVGNDQFNQTLSEQRAGSVRDYLVQEGVGRDSVTSTGFGNTEPVASNSSAAGRQANRRVELVVSGEAIGKQTSPPTGNRP
ncbi:MAG TPA: OmpA family protein [Candidatus Angelobacter sp.]|nr:OmpA family protein [Candidatus Angelobacter sp.]